MVAILETDLGQERRALDPLAVQQRQEVRPLDPTPLGLGQAVERQQRRQEVHGAHELAHAPRREPRDAQQERDSQLLFVQRVGVPLDRRVLCERLAVVREEQHVRARREAVLLEGREDSADVAVGESDLAPIALALGPAGVVRPGRLVIQVLHVRIEEVHEQEPGPVVLARGA